MQALPKSVFILVFCIPLAVVFGVMLAAPLDPSSMIGIGAGLFLLLLPVLLMKHQALLIVSANAYVNAYFLPGQPHLWLIAGAISCLFVVLTFTLNRGKIRFINVPSITWSLIFFFLVTYATAQSTGGAGARVFGSGQFGGRHYFYLWGAFAVYFAISSIGIPEEKRKSYAGLFFLSGVTSAVSNLAYTLGPNFYFLFLLFPPEYAVMQAIGGDFTTITRINGLAPAALSVFCFMMVRYGLRGLLNLTYFWRSAVTLLVLVFGLYSGFRWLPVFIAILFVVQFFAEGLHKTRYLAIALAFVLLAGGFISIAADRLPLAVQRCFTVLPLKLDAAAVEDARGSSMWRLEMWRVLIGDIPKYFWRGKGFAIDPKDLYFATEGLRFGGASGIDGSIVAGDYHNGPLSIIIPFGIWGVLSFLWFTLAAIRALWLNFKNSGEDLKKVNTFLFVFFVGKLIFFSVIFGVLWMDMLLFTATVALSVSINRGVRTAPAVSSQELVLQPTPQVVAGTLQPA